MDRAFLIIGSLLGALGVAAGALAAHTLKDRLPADRFNLFEVGAHYHLIHALAVLAAAWVAHRWPGPASSAAGWLFIIGIVFFSGSLYALGLSGLRALGAITPFGGVAFIAGWLMLGWAVWQGRG